MQKFSIIFALIVIVNGLLQLGKRNFMQILITNILSHYA
jgi:hypothetical protein